MNHIEWKNFSQQVIRKSTWIGVFMRLGISYEVKSKSDQVWIKCPFHSEETPSFTVNLKKNVFYCFGCHAGGGIAKFIMLYHHVNYRRAIEILADMFHVEKTQPSSVDPAQSKLESQLIEILRRAGTFFHNALKIPAYGEHGMAYLASRGIFKSTIDHFNFGFAPDSWDKLSTAFQNAGYSKDLLIQAGLILQSKKNSSRFYDRFRNRIMIPICDERGRVIAFGGRSIDGSEPKYLNSADSPVFNKRKILFGLDRASRAIFQRKSAIICEGYLDAISLSAAGIQNAVASLGTAFTEDHAKLLSRFTNQIYFCYDSDNAGQIATNRAIPIAESHNLTVKIIHIPDAKDPDEFLQNHTKDDFENLVQNAISAFDFQLNFQISQLTDQSIESRAKILRNILPILQKLKPIEQHEYIHRIAIKLFIDEAAIYRELDESKIPNKSTKPQIYQDSRTGSIVAAGRFILQLLLESPEMIPNVLDFLPNGFNDPLHQEIFLHIQKSEPLENLSPEASKELKIIQNYPNVNKIKAYQDSLYRLRIDYLKHQKQHYVKEGNFSEVEKIQKEINELNAEFRG